MDFVIGRLAIEVKAKTIVSARDFRGLRALREERLFDRYIVVCMESARREVDGIEVVPWAEFLKELYEGKPLD